MRIKIVFLYMCIIGSSLYSQTIDGDSSLGKSYTLNIANPVDFRMTIQEFEAISECYNLWLSLEPDLSLYYIVVDDVGEYIHIAFLRNNLIEDDLAITYVYSKELKSVVTRLLQM